jgi:hypothetical protein
MIPLDKPDHGGRQTPFAALRRFARPNPAGTAAARERCELCGVGLAPEHRHLWEMTQRRVACACDPCALLFLNAVGGRFKLIPRDACSLPGFQLSDAAWENLALPINLAFFFHSTPLGKTVALYPSPAGATESLLPLPAWEALVQDNPGLGQMQPDVEALLVNRVGEARDFFLAPIDVCFELVGLIRLHWRGLSGGTEVWQEIAAFFNRLKENARPLVIEEPVAANGKDHA